MELELSMPMIGEDISEAKISRISAKEGDSLHQDDIFIEITTDKVDIELPSPLSGRIVKIMVSEGQVVKAGETLVKVSTDDSPSLANRRLDTADLRTALRYLTTRSSSNLCSRKELGQQRFEDFQEFVDQSVLIASRFEEAELDAFDTSLQEDLRASLFFVTDLIKRLQGYNPQRLKQRRIAEHRKIYDILSKQSGHALQSFQEVLTRAGLSLDTSGEVDPTKAYVFISYPHTETKTAHELAARLQRNRIAHFLDKKIGFGETFPSRIHNELEKASHMIVLISPASQKSAWVPYEVGYGRARGVIIIPYLLHPSIDIPSFIAHEHHLTRSEDDENRLAKELADFRREAPKSPAPGIKLEPWRSAIAKERITTAGEIWHQSVSSYVSIEDSSKELESFVRSGGQLHCLLTDPEGIALKRGLLRNLGRTATIANLESDFKATRGTLARIARCARNGGSVTLKIIDFLPEPILTIVDPSRENGAIFVTLSGFGQNPASRPSFLLRKNRDATWFNFYRNSFEQIWNHPMSKEIDLRWF